MVQKNIPYAYGKLPLVYVRRNLNKCDESTKAAAYLGLVRPKFEYASAVWDPHLSKDINAIERVQRIAVRWVRSNYNWENSVSSMLSELVADITCTKTHVETYNIL